MRRWFHRHPNVALVICALFSLLFFHYLIEAWEEGDGVDLEVAWYGLCWFVWTWWGFYWWDQT